MMIRLFNQRMSSSSSSSYQFTSKHPSTSIHLITHHRYNKNNTHICTATNNFPPFLPTEFANEITEPAALDLMQRIQQTPVTIPNYGTINTAFIGPQTPSPDKPQLILLHAFDSSCLEFRRCFTSLSEFADVWAVDLIGWGFTDSTSFIDNPDKPLGPEQKRQHLLAFIQTVIKTDKVSLLGTSLGGAVCLDFSLAYPDIIDKLILVDAQGFIDGVGPLSSLPRMLAVLGVRILRSIALRSFANNVAYVNKGKLATDDAMRVGRLHTHLPGWEEANVAFMKSGGYSLSRRIEEVGGKKTLVVWGRQDNVLDPGTAQKFIDVLPNAELKWIEECGHFPALEQPEQLVKVVKEFICSNGDGPVEGKGKVK